MCEAYCVRVSKLKKAFSLFNETIKQDLLEYIPMGDNYCVNFHGCDNEDQCSLCIKYKDDESWNHRYIRNYNGLQCVYQDDEYYHNSSVNLREHFKRTHPSMDNSIIMHPHVFKKIERQVETVDPKLWIRLNFCGIEYRKCLYDSTKKESYIYDIQTHCIVNFIDSANQIIHHLLDTTGAIGYTTGGKKENDDYSEDSYESLYKNAMTLRQHVEMYKRDSKQCSHNTVHHNINYGLSLDQKQFDLLKYAYLNDETLKDETLKGLWIVKKPVDGTNAVCNIDEKSKYLSVDLLKSWSRKKDKSDMCCLS